jgi:platelet-activating factor acetylhydrolase
MEHRDGSGARTLVNHTPEGLGSHLEREAAGRIKHNLCSDKHSFDVVDFIFPKDGPNNTSPGHRIDRELRKAQIEIRLAELEEACTAVAKICAGQGESLAEKDLLFKGAIGSPSQGLEGIG